MEIAMMSKGLDNAGGLQNLRSGPQVFHCSDWVAKPTNVRLESSRQLRHMSSRLPLIIIANYGFYTYFTRLKSIKEKFYYS
ncbi:hypothetical protein CEP53_010556 [Fusarium sp. AF-6]|nr:hypothetical protein CEP53_010556 [Fusarium sp. AF-6]